MSLFGGVSGGVSNGGNAAPTRAAIAALPNPVVGSTANLEEKGREGPFIVDLAANWTASIAADTTQGVFIPSTVNPTLVYRRVVQGPFESTWWGVSPSGLAADNTSAFNVALATLATLGVSGHGYANGGTSLYTPTGFYQFNGQLKPESAVDIHGDYDIGGGGTVFKFTQTNAHGFNLQGWDGTNRHASGSAIRGIYIEGAYAGPSSRLGFNAIEVNTSVRIEDVFVDSWPGKAVNAHADLAANQGDVNGSVFRNISAQLCDWTLWLQGADANGCIVDNIGGSSNRFGAYADKSFLGNGGHLGVIADNGFDANFLNRCHVSGHIYSVAYGQEVWCSTNAPTGQATSNQGWTYVLDGGPTTYAPTWSTGLTWFFAAPIIINDDGGNSFGKIFGGYLESGQNPCVIGNRCMLVLDAWSGRIVNINGTSTSGLDAGGVMSGNGSAINFQRDITVGNMATINNQLNIGPTTGFADGLVFLNGMNTGAQLWFQRPGLGITDGYIMYVNGAGYWNALNGFNFRVGGADIAGVSAGGINLLAGKTLSVNGTQVVGARQTGIPIAATDAATTQALVNALRTALIAHGLVS